MTGIWKRKEEGISQNLDWEPGKIYDYVHFLIRMRFVTPREWFSPTGRRNKLNFDRGSRIHIFVKYWKKMLFRFFFFLAEFFKKIFADFFFFLQQ